MQNRYVGDVGDFVKLAILRALVSEDSDRKLGIAWWLFPDESHNADGKHRAYLDQPKKWEHFDSAVFKALNAVRDHPQRNVKAIEEAGLFRDAIYADDLVPCGERPISSRCEKRKQWLQVVEEKLQPCDIVFLDPDNGIASPGWKATQKRAGKIVSLDDLKSLRREGRALIVYHHQTRFKGGHEEEIRHLSSRLHTAGFQVTGALRAKPWSARAFFILDGDEDLRRRAENISAHWQDWITWHPFVPSH